MAETSVKVHIYDISKGLARSMSMAFLGKQLNGIWHTAVVAYGQEIFFGGDGINSCIPCGTILGRPDEVFDMGTTEIPYEVFMDYLNDIATTTYRPECYHLFNKNCNNFTAEISNFLTGKHIPSHITSLPADVLDTPFGAMIKPFVDAMSVSPSGGHVMFPDSSQETQQQTSTESLKSQPESQSSTNTEQESNKNENFTPFIHDRLGIQELKDLQKELRDDLSTSERTMFNDVIDYVTEAHCNWSLGRQHIDTLISLLTNPALSPSQHQQVLRLWQSVIVRDGVAHLLGQDTRLMKYCHKYTSEITLQQAELVKMLCNCGASTKGHTFLTDTNRWAIDMENTSNCDIVSQLCASCLIDEDQQLREAGASLGYNLTLLQIDEDTAVNLASAILHGLCHGNNEQTAFHMLSSLRQMTDSYTQVCDLCKLIGLAACDEQQDLSSRVKTVCDSLQAILTA